MGIPDRVESKLDSDPSWTIQHVDIVRVMDDVPTDKPWSRYMLQQHLDGNPSKKTVQSRLDELVELDVLNKYEYSNQTLYDLAYDPIVTDGGRLKDASIIEIATLQDINGARDLVTGAIFLCGLFLCLGFLTEVTAYTANFDISGNFYIDAAIALYFLAFVIAILVGLFNKLDSFRSDSAE